MDYQQQIQQYFAAQRQKMIEDICKLVRIRSVGEEAEPGKPYGPGPAAALAQALDMAREMGFAVRNYDNYVGTADLNDQPTQLAILAHLDVVHEGTGWTVTQPYEPLEKDGKLYGRGTGDDKGPAVAALYAMKAVKDLGLPLTKNVRLILGTDEERGSSDLNYYFNIEKAPPMSFSPDASYPVINIEKGGLHSAFTAQWKPDAASGCENRRRRRAQHRGPKGRSPAGGHGGRDGPQILRGIPGQNRRPFFSQLPGRAAADGGAGPKRPRLHAGKGKQRRPGFAGGFERHALRPVGGL